MGHGGDVSFHEGYISSKEARRLERGGSVEKLVRPELSAPLASYIDLHRHAAVRAKVGASPAIALRLMLAHAMAGSSLWRVDVASQRGATDAWPRSTRRERALFFSSLRPSVCSGSLGRHKHARRTVHADHRPIER